MNIDHSERAAFHAAVQDLADALNEPVSRLATAIILAASGFATLGDRLRQVMEPTRTRSGRWRVAVASSTGGVRFRVYRTKRLAEQAMRRALGVA